MNKLVALSLMVSLAVEPIAARFPGVACHGPELATMSTSRVSSEALAPVPWAAGLVPALQAVIAGGRSAGLFSSEQPATAGIYWKITRRKVLIAATGLVAAFGIWSSRQQEFPERSVGLPERPTLQDDDKLMRLSEKRGSRYIVYREYGPPNSNIHIVVYHGAFDSRFPFALFMEAAAVWLGVHLIIPERPGVGLSTPHPGRTPADWTEDMKEFIPHVLKGAEFSIFGYSVGGKYALDSLAAELPNLVKIMLVSSPGPLSSFGVWRHYLLKERGWLVAFVFARWFPKVALSTMEGIVSRIKNNWSAYYGEAKGGMIYNSPPEDKAVLRQTGMSELIRVARQASVAGANAAAGAVQELQAGLRSFRLDPAKGKRVILYHGEQDPAVPFAFFELLKVSLPGAIAKPFAGMAHHMVRILFPYFLAQLKHFHLGEDVDADPLSPEVGLREFSQELDAKFRRLFTPAPRPIQERRVVRWAA